MEVRVAGGDTIVGRAEAIDATGTVGVSSGIEKEQAAEVKRASILLVRSLWTLQRAGWEPDSGWG